MTAHETPSRRRSARRSGRSWRRAGLVEFDSGDVLNSVSAHVSDRFDVAGVPVAVEGVTELLVRPDMFTFEHRDRTSDHADNVRIRVARFSGSLG